MAKPKDTSYREDLSEMPDWLKKKKCPHRDKYLSGKRILPKNITGKEKLADLVDETLPRLQLGPPQGRLPAVRREDARART